MSNIPRRWTEERIFLGKDGFYNKPTTVVNLLLEIIDEAIPSNYSELSREDLADIIYSYFELDNIKERLEDYYGE